MYYDMNTYKSFADFKEVKNVTEKKLIIRSRKYNGETSVTSIRLPKDLLVAIDEVAVKTGRTRNEILLMSIEFALDNMQIEE